jgi:hypothetical protein
MTPVDLTLHIVLIVVALVLIGSAILGWPRTRPPRSAEKKGEQQGQLPRSEAGRVSATTASVRIIATNAARKIETREIAHVVTHWRTDETCYATLSLQSGEEITGLVATVDVDALLSGGASEKTI